MYSVITEVYLFTYNKMILRQLCIIAFVEFLETIWVLDSRQDKQTRSDNGNHISCFILFTYRCCHKIRTCQTFYLQYVADFDKQICIIRESTCLHNKLIATEDIPFLCRIWMDSIKFRNMLLLPLTITPFCSWRFTIVVNQSLILNRRRQHPINHYTAEISFFLSWMRNTSKVIKAIFKRESFTEVDLLK